ncbi:hypothetical protein [Pseudomonas turukhanskensis]|uniref:Transmembrane protein n=1 Tax=Pseudomonas turukhanskensis TaxID=1806536 RepID=A0A9W6K5C7_9PSED|nr:hypothetical protein [Pseudomonas turukhanskensis]GLK88289.1 hypothetical protein GCM10017655_13510 [Pseudomonas turukhanskensis]
MTRLSAALIALAWLATFAAVSLLGAPVMLRSGIPYLTILAFVAPCLWVLASVLLYVTWADADWQEEWEGPVKPSSARDSREHAFGLPRGKINYTCSSRWRTHNYD